MLVRPASCYQNILELDMHYSAGKEQQQREGPFFNPPPPPSLATYTVVAQQQSQWQKHFSYQDIFTIFFYLAERTLPVCKQHVSWLSETSPLFLTKVFQGKLTYRGLHAVARQIWTKQRQESPEKSASFNRQEADISLSHRGATAV